MSTAEKIIELCKERNIPVAKLEKDCGFSNGYIRNMKGRDMPLNKATKAAVFLNVPVSRIFEGLSADTEYQYLRKGYIMALIENDPILTDCLDLLLDIPPESKPFVRSILIAVHDEILKNQE